ncbi:signal recognition particle-docking protein FtsY [Shewanella frigidimarina]|uniref:Signal recognition particle receptor FtsY n=1 Tax=Shewanella frigidimarina (strain NCIMB 400) TaxID=318167 RepID=Q089C7_SHEFN|nr:signal recognition particle-docking protein FtsY [Shewanella frigidimarina]ABI70138.1 signal recognition particle-docking protein FtsY [Shewanella frigidimarina NCIMB 400]
MAKKGFFSWFRKDKPVPEVEEQQQLDVDAENEVVTETAEQPQQAEQLEQTEATARLDVERLEQERLETELAEQARIDAERIAADKLAADVLTSEKLAAEKLATEQAEQQKQALETERLEAERVEQLRLEQLDLENKRLEQERVDNERAELARIDAERIAAEKLATEQAEQQKQAQETQRLETERLEAERVEQLRLEQLNLEKKRLEQERVDNERVEQARVDAERTAAETLATEALAAELAAQQLAEQQLAEQQAAEQQAPIESIELAQQDEPQAKPQKEGMFARLKRGLMRTSENIGSGFIGLFRGKKINEELFEELEEQLLIADVGVETTNKLIKSLTEHASRKQLKDAEALYDLMREEMQKMLDPVAIPLVPDNANGPFVILMIGVNGVGKTTTIGKLAKQYQSQGKSVMLAAGDTFRAAAVEQLQVWGQRNNIPVVAQHTGADSASVIFDALQAAKARKVDVLIADTAGRLQNKSHLMEELKKVVRVMKKLDPDSPHEVMLTLDASTGQNAISQAQLFKEAVGVTGITISKLDGTAKGGVIFAIADKFSIPIRHIGVGEQIDDLRTFNSNDFIEALFSQDKTDQ